MIVAVAVAVKAFTKDSSVGEKEEMWERGGETNRDRTDSLLWLSQELRASNTAPITAYFGNIPNHSLEAATKEISKSSFFDLFNQKF